MNSVVFLDIKKRLLIFMIIKFLWINFAFMVLLVVNLNFSSPICLTSHRVVILGPLLFIINMNDLPLAVPNTNITLFAYDTSLNTGAEGNSPLTTSYRRRIFACLSRFFRARGGRNDFCLHACVKWKCDGRICLGLEHYKPVLHREL